MTITLVLTAALLVEAPGTKPGLENDAVEYVEVAYTEMMQGKTDEAIARIRGNKRLAADHPAALINLGTAYARKGMRAEAIAYFNAARTSIDRYELQLADGSWMDSRRAARMALARLASSGALSLR